MNNKLPTKICGNCLYFEQGEKGSFCGNPKQGNEDLKQYTYYPFACRLYRKGIADSRLLYMEQQEKLRRESFEQYMESARGSRVFTTFKMRMRELLFRL